MLKIASKPVDVQDLHFKLQSRLKIFNKEDGQLQKAFTHLLASASRFGLIFVGCNSTILKVFRFESIEENSSTKTTTNCPRREIPLSSRPCNISVNHDDTILAVVGEKNNCRTVTFYDVLSFYKEEVVILNEIRLTSSPDVEILQANWHPTINNIFTECKSDGTLGVYELKDKSFEIKTLPVESRACCFCWSPKGKQIAVGSQDGKIIHYKPDLKAVKSIDAPPFEKPHSVLSLQWISNYQFVAVYKTSQEPDPECNVVVIDAPKTGNPVFTNFYDICYSNGDLRPPQFYMISEQKWNILLVSSANSMEVAVMLNTGETWTQCILPDSARAELPLDENQDETFPVGMSVDISSVKPVLWGESYLQPAPSLLLLSHDGVLCSFRMINLKEGAPSLNSPPETVGDLSGLKFFVAPNTESAEKADLSEKKAANPALQPSTPQQEKPNQKLPNETITSKPQVSQQPTTPLSTFKTATTPKQTLPTNLFGGQISLTPIKGSKDAKSATSAAIMGAALLSNTSSDDGVRGVNMTTTQRKTTTDNPSFSGMPAGTLNTLNLQKSLAESTTHSSFQNTIQKTPTLINKEVDEHECPDIKDMLEKMIRIESIALDKEIRDLIAQGHNLRINLNDEEMNGIVCRTESFKEFLKELVETCEIQSSEIHTLKQSTIQSWAWLEEARSRYKDSQDKELESLMKSKPLDSVSEKHLDSLKQMQYYLSSQLAQCHKALDEQWDRFQDYCRKTSRVQLPTMEAIFQTMVKQNAVLQKHNYILKDIKSQLKGKQNASNRAALFNPLDKKDNLENSFQNMKLKPESINHIYHQKVMNRVKSLPANKTNHLRRMLHNREVPHVMVKSQMSTLQLNSSLKLDTITYKLMKTPTGKKTDSVEMKINEASPLNITSAPKISSTPLPTLADNTVLTGKTQPQTASFPSNLKLFTETTDKDSVPPQNSSFKTPTNLSQHSQGFSVLGNKNVSSSNTQTFNFVKPSLSSDESARPANETQNLLRLPLNLVGTSQPVNVFSFVSSQSNSTSITTLSSTTSNISTSPFSISTPKSTTVTSSTTLSGSIFGNNLSFKNNIVASTQTPSSAKTTLIFGVPSTNDGSVSEKSKEVVPKTVSSIFGSSSASLPSFSFQHINANKPNTTSVINVTNSVSLQSSSSTAFSFVNAKPVTSQSMFGTSGEIRSNGQSIFGLSATTPSFSQSLTGNNSSDSTSKVTFSFSANARALDGKSSSTVSLASLNPSQTLCSSFKSGSQVTNSLATTTVTTASTSLSGTSANSGNSASSLSTTTTSVINSTTTTSVINSTTTTSVINATPITTSSGGQSSNTPSFAASSTSSIFGSSTGLFGDPVSTHSGSGSSVSSQLTKSSNTNTTTVTSSSSIFGSSPSSGGNIFGGSQLSNISSTNSTIVPKTSSSVSKSGGIFGLNKSSDSPTSGGTTLPSTVPVSSSSSIFGTSQSSASTQFSGTTAPGASSSIFGAPASNSGSLFGVSQSTSGTSVQSTSPIFGSSVSNSGSLFGVSQSSNAPATGGTSIFGSAVSSSGGGLIGASGITSASSTSVFGNSVPSTGGIFGSTSSSQSGMPAANTSIFGTAATANAAVPPTTKSVFGALATTSIFGVKQETTSSVTSSSSIFGQPAAGSSPFGNEATFGATTTATPAFGVTVTSSTPFGASAFNATPAASSPFGNAQSAFGTSDSPFGSTSPNVCSPFGTAQTFGNNFNSNTTAQSSPFGQGGIFSKATSSTSNFGAAPKTTESSFGFGSLNVGDSQSPFGKSNENKSPFGNTSFGNTASSGSLFGSSSFGNNSGGSVFRQSSFGGTTSFGTSQHTSGPFSGGDGSIAQSGFGVTQQTTPAFGATPSFGGSPAFGAAPTFGGAPAFGNTSPFGGSTSKVFGSSSSTTSTGSVFGSYNQQSSGFGSFSSQNSLGFGSLAQPSNTQNENPGFGTFANQNTVGFGNLAQQTGSPGQSTPFSGNSSFSSWR